MLNNINMSIPLKVIYRLSVIPNKILAELFKDIDKLILKKCEKSKTRIDNIILKKRKRGKLEESHYLMLRPNLKL